MTKLTLQQMREKLKAQEDRKSNFGPGDSAIYPFWNIQLNATATVRYLPDGGDNDFFWVERAVIKMPFPGTLNGDTNKPITVQVPCMHMYGKSCPVQEEIKALNWWNGSEEEKALARTYYKKKSYLYQGFVVTSPIKEESSPENPIRRFVINAKLHEKTKAAFMNPEIDDLVVDYDNGLDFKITKTKQGHWDSYDTSEFARKTRSLNDFEREAIEKHGLFDLKSFLPKEPTDDQIALIREMFEDSVGNQLFDAEKYKDFAPRIFNKDSTETSTDSAKVSSKTDSVKDEAKEEVVEEKKASPEPVKLKPTSTGTSSAPKKSAQEVLEMLKAKNRK